MSTFLFIYGIAVGVVLGFMFGCFLFNVFGNYYNENFSYVKRIQLEFYFFIMVWHGIACYKFVDPPMLWWTAHILGGIGVVLASVYLFASM